MATVEAVTVLVASILIQAATAAAEEVAVVMVEAIVVVSPVITKRNKSDCTNTLGIADIYSCILAYFQLIFSIH